MRKIAFYAHKIVVDIRMEVCIMNNVVAVDYILTAEVIIMENLENMSIQELFDEIIDWSREYRNVKNVNDVHYAASHIHEYLTEIRKRTLAEICSSDEE